MSNHDKVAIVVVGGLLVTNPVMAQTKPNH